MNKPTKSQVKLLQAKAELNRVWFLMCQHDAIDPHSKFVSFSKDNPFQAEYAGVFLVYAMAYTKALKAERKNRARRERRTMNKPTKSQLKPSFGEELK
jgi:hypothetical protein